MNIDLSEIRKICEEAINGRVLTQNEIEKLIACPDEHADVIFDAADKIRAAEVGEQVHLRGLIEFSNICKKNCSYCGIRKSNNNIMRYRMEIDEIIETAKNAEKLGYRSVVLQSGEDSYFTADRLAFLVRAIKADTDLAITLSVGEYSYEDYKIMREAGADRFLLRFETADRELYKALHPDSDFDERIQCLHALRDLGFQVGSGFMAGLPGETPEIAAKNIMLLRELDLDMVGIGPFLPSPDTPLKDEKGGTLMAALKAVALARLVLRNAHIPATTAMGTIDPQGRQKALKAGANVVMPNVTPLKYRDMYLLYPNKICTGDDASHCRNCMGGIIRSIGRTVASDHGHSLKSRSSN